MAASVGGYPSAFSNGGPASRAAFGNGKAAAAYYNDDPGVYEPECDWHEEQPAYPDTQEFVQEFQEQFQQRQAAAATNDQSKTQANAVEEPGQAAVDALKLSGDYQGLGGPTSVPLYTPKAFEKPPQIPSILGEIFMEPTPEQLEAYNRVLLKGRVVDTKRRLKWSIFVHYILVFIIITKLLPEILDIVDIFILEIEELFVPKALIWEWLWLLSVPVTFFGLSACKKSNLIAIRRFMVGSLLFSLLPILLGMGMHASDFFTFLMEDEEEEREQIVMWQGYPYSTLWYAFFFVALQVHCFQLYFANCLMKVWLPAMKKSQ